MVKVNLFENEKFLSQISNFKYEIFEFHGLEAKSFSGQSQIKCFEKINTYHDDHEDSVIVAVLGQDSSIFRSYKIPIQSDNLLNKSSIKTLDTLYKYNIMNKSLIGTFLNSFGPQQYIIYQKYLMRNLFLGVTSLGKIIIYDIYKQSIIKTFEHCLDKYDLENFNFETVIKYFAYNDEADKRYTLIALMAKSESNHQLYMLSFSEYNNEQSNFFKITSKIGI